MAGTEVQSFYYKFFGDTKGFDKSLKNVENSLSKIGNAFGRLQKIVSIALGGKIVADMASFGMKMGLLSTQTNIGVKSLTALSSAFMSAGSNAQTLQGVLTRLEAGLSGISMGDARIAGVLSTYGINPFDETGRIKTGYEVLLEASDWSKQQKGIGRDERQIRQKLMSDFGVDVGMANLMISGGSAGIQAEMNRAIAEGRTLSKGATESLSSLNVALKELSDTVKYNLLEGVAEVAPIFKATAVVLKEDVKYAFLSVKAVINGLLDILKGFMSALFMLGEAIGEIVAGVVNAVKTLFGWVGKLFNLFSDEDEQKKKTESLFPEAKKPEFPVLFGGSDNGGSTARDFIITDEAGNVLDLSQIPYIGSSGNNYDIKVEMTNNIETTADPEAIGVAIEEKAGLGITNALSSNSGG